MALKGEVACTQILSTGKPFDPALLDEIHAEPWAHGKNIRPWMWTADLAWLAVLGKLKGQANRDHERLIGLERDHGALVRTVDDHGQRLAAVERKVRP